MAPEYVSDVFPGTSEKYSHWEYTRPCGPRKCPIGSIFPGEYYAYNIDLSVCIDLPVCIDLYDIQCYIHICISRSI